MNAVLQMPFEGLNLDLDVKMTRGRVQDLRIYLHNRLKKVHLLHRSVIRNNRKMYFWTLNINLTVHLLSLIHI